MTGFRLLASAFGFCGVAALCGGVHFCLCAIRCGNGFRIDAPWCQYHRPLSGRLDAPGPRLDAQATDAGLGLCAAKSCTSMTQFQWLA